MFDNVERTTNLEPLLPALGDSAILITTRHLLTFSSPAQEVQLGPLDEAAFQRLVELLVGETIVGDLAAFRELRTLVGALPLAARLAAGVIRQMGWTILEYVERLRLSKSLDWLGEEGSEDIRRSFSLSFATLRDASQRECFSVIGLLGSLPVTAQALAVATARTTADTERTLMSLVMRGLVENIGGSFSSHPLMERYAYELATASGTEATYRERIADFCRGHLSQWNPDRHQFIYSSLGHLEDVTWGVAAVHQYLAAHMAGPAQKALVAIADLLTLAGREGLLNDLIDRLTDQIDSLDPWLRLYSASFTAFGRRQGADPKIGIRTLESLCSDADSKIASAAWIEIAQLDLKVRDFAGAEVALKASADLKRQMDPPGNKGLAYILNETARLIAKERGDYAGAVRLHNEAFDTQRTIADVKGMAYSLLRRGVIELWHLNDVEAATRTFAESEHLARNSNNKFVQGEALMQIAEIWSRCGRYKAAQDQFLKCIALAEECDYLLLLARVYKRLGSLYETVEQYGRAREAMKRSHELFLIIEDEQEAKRVSKPLRRIEERVQLLEGERRSVEVAITSNLGTGVEIRRLRRRRRRLHELLNLVPVQISLGRSD